MLHITRSNKLSMHFMFIFMSYIVIFFFQHSAAHRDLHSFPTRRSSDLRRRHRLGVDVEVRRHARDVVQLLQRSEEHTSELQSCQYLVCRLLLEKKKKTKKNYRKKRIIYQKDIEYKARISKKEALVLICI